MSLSKLLLQEFLTSRSPSLHFKIYQSLVSHSFLRNSHTQQQDTHHLLKIRATQQLSDKQTTRKKKKDKTKKKMSRKRNSYAEIAVNPLESGVNNEQKLEFVSSSVPITSEDFSQLLSELQAMSDPSEILKYISAQKNRYLFGSLELIQILDCIPSKKTQISIIELIGPRLTDPKKYSNDILNRFRFAEEKQIVQDVLKARMVAQHSNVFASKKPVVGGGRLSPQRRQQQQQQQLPYSPKGLTPKEEVSFHTPDSTEESKSPVIEKAIDNKISEINVNDIVLLNSQDIPSLSLPSSLPLQQSSPSQHEQDHEPVPPPTEKAETIVEVSAASEVRVDSISYDLDIILDMSPLTTNEDLDSMIADKDAVEKEIIPPVEEVILNPYSEIYPITDVNDTPPPSASSPSSTTSATTEFSQKPTERTESISGKSNEEFYFDSPVIDVVGTKTRVLSTRAPLPSSKIGSEGEFITQTDEFSFDERFQNSSERSSQPPIVEPSDQTGYGKLLSKFPFGRR